MDFIISKVLWTVLRPSTLLLLVGWIGILCIWRGRRRFGLSLITVMLACFLVILLLPVNQWLLFPLEDRFPPVANAPSHVDGIIVLGGAVDTELTEAHGMPALNEAAERMTSFVALAQRYTDARLAFAGGSGLLMHGHLSEADVAKALFDQLGMSRPVVYDNRSRNTYENAVLLRDRVSPQPGEIWILITSASHMPRAVGIFRKLGWPVLPWPVAYKTGHTLSIEYQEALPAKLGELDWAAHEWIGLVAYWLLGRTSELLPGPTESALHLRAAAVDAALSPTDTSPKPRGCASRQA
jgi:uncharacterized SAM-binding protein YcdF (DUF218 family)